MFFRRTSQRSRVRRSERGQATVEYVLTIALAGLFGLMVTRFFLGTFSEGMQALTVNLGVRLGTGENFTQ